MEPVEIKIVIKGDSSTDSIMRELKEKLEYRTEKGDAEDDYNADYAIINGIKLKRENEALCYCEYFIFDEGLWLAESRGLRVPTNDEWKKCLKRALRLMIVIKASG